MKVIKGVRTPAAEVNVADVRARPVSIKIVGSTALFNLSESYDISNVCLFNFNRKEKNKRNGCSLARHE